MKELSTPHEIQKKLKNMWTRGHFLKHYDEIFPFTFPVGTISSQKMIDEYDLVRTWVASYKKDERITPYLQWIEKNHRILGRNMIPRNLKFETIEDIACFLGTCNELEIFLHALKQLKNIDSRLESWGKSHPLELIRLGKNFERLLTLYLWMVDHPRPNIYLRQIDIPGIDTKFTETYRSTLSSWLDLTLAENSIDTSATRFERRYGFKGKPELVRFRILDQNLSWNNCDDISIPAGQFSDLYDKADIMPFSHVFVVENDICALSFPSVAHAIVIFGRGYSFDYLAACKWLHQVKIYYWGDLDTHGFRILDQFRSLFPQTKSFLMDAQTLKDHSISWGEEGKPTTGELYYLTETEKDLYNNLRFNAIQKNLRLEQEFIRYSVVQKALIQIGVNLL